MATDTRQGFRLPWAAGTGDSEDQPATGDASVAEEAQEPDMIETATMSEQPVTSEPSATSDPPGETEAAGRPAARRATRFMAELSRAMQSAVENARTETMARFEVEAKTVVEEIHANATNEAADLRRKADDDVAAIRERSKAEIARIREETEARIAARKAGLDGEMEEHAATIEARAARVSAVVAAFEAELAAFFERLNAEEDPTRIATMAETMPEPPSLADVAASIAGASEPSSERLTRLLAPAADEDGSTGIDFAAAEAEAASFTGDLESEDDLPAAQADQLESVSADDPAPTVEDSLAAELSSTRVVVSGLVSVANIANFKRSLGRLEGISTIAVASGRDGDFAFTVGHSLGSALSASVQALPGFDIQITGESDDAIIVAAQDRDAND
jgi:hypothetical protein